jgi:predicted  nucleic acid-binding Zn-ribbon protein
MPAVMRILGWKAEGLRCPDHEIDCCNSQGEPYTVSLVQMPTGTGKTTTLTLLRAALSGAAHDRNWDREKIKEFLKKGNTNSEGTFEVRLLLNDRRVTIIMNFDFENERIYYKTTRGPGQVDDFDPPVEFRRFLNENFVNFFVFDGELAQNLLDKTHTDAEGVVENLFQINSFSTIAQKVAAYWESKAQGVSATEERGLSRRQNRLSNLKSRLEILKNEKRKLEEEKVEIAARLTKQQDTYNQEIKKEEVRSSRLTKAETKVEQLKAKVREEALEVLDTMRDPHAMSSTFAKSMYELKIGLDRVKLPESAAREFFEELAAELICVCGRPIDEKIKEVIRSRAAQYLGSDDVSLLNSMKTAIQEVVGLSLGDSEKLLIEKMSNLEKAVRQERDALNELDQLRLEAEQSDPTVKKAREEIKHLGGEMSRIDQELEKFDSKDHEQGDDKTFGIEIIEKRIQDAEDKLAEITHTIELKTKRDILTSIINKAHEKAREGITKAICTEANRRILELMPYNNISIDRIERSLVLHGQEGGSVGETLSVAYAFLATLFHRTEHELPFVVDSPAGPIDLAVRPKIGELIPRLTDQFIAFTISSEREGFVQSLKNASNSEIQFITLFRKGSSQLERAARATSDFSETLDGLTVHGEAFFNDFQLDKEEAS